MMGAGSGVLGVGVQCGYSREILGRMELGTRGKGLGGWRGS